MKLRALHRKLLRELRASAGVLITVIFIISIGVGCFIGVGSAAHSLETAQFSYYRDYRFADFWVDLRRAPLTAVDRVRNISGVATADSRLIFDVIVDLPGEPRPMTGRLISVPPRGFERILNGLHLVRGSGFSDERDEELIVTDTFAAAHNLNPGDRIELILNRKRQQFIIVGTAISPEYVYLVRGEGDFLPDPQHFGTLYIKERFAREVLGYKDACNQIVGTWAAGQEQNAEFILRRIERELDQYGVAASTPRERQPSHRFVSDEIKQQKTAAKVTPAIFLGVAALVLNVLMGRLAERQRTIIGTLKALGYSNGAVLRHFLAFGLAVGLAGGLLGIAMGYGAGNMLIAVYTNMFKFPRFVFEAQPDLIVYGLLISAFFAVAGTARGVWTVLRLHPAEAMRPKPPEMGRAMWLERWPWLWKKLGFRTHMALRGLARHPVRTVSGIVSTALATGIIMMSATLLTSIWYLVTFQFERVLHSDVNIALRDPASRSGFYEIRDLPGVDYAEPIFTIACDMRNGRFARRMGVIGLAEPHSLSTPMQNRQQELQIPPEGIVLSKKLAEILNLRTGDRFELIPVRGRRDPVWTFVADVSESYLGLDAHARADYVARLVGESFAVSSVDMLVNPAQQEELYRSVKQLPAVQGLTVRLDSIEIVKHTFVKTIATIHSILICFAGMIAFGSILNNALVEIGDRLREVSTLRVLGYEPREIAGVFFRQSAIVFCVGLVLAIPISYGLVLIIVSNTPTELVRLPIIRNPYILSAAAGLASLFVLIAQALVYRHLKKLDWLEGIKVKE